MFYKKILGPLLLGAPLVNLSKSIKATLLGWVTQKKLLAKTMYGPHLLLLTNFDLAPPSRGYSTDQSQFYRILLRDPLVGWVKQKISATKVVVHI